jgi:hypothetical protein
MLGNKKGFDRDKECSLDGRITQHVLHKGSIHMSHIIIPLHYGHDQCNNKTQNPSVFIMTEFCDNSFTWWSRVWFLVRMAPFFSTSLLEPALCVEPTQLPMELLWTDRFANLSLTLSFNTQFIFAPCINLDSVLFSYYYGYRFEFQNELSQVRV